MMMKMESPSHAVTVILNQQSSL